MFTMLFKSAIRLIRRHYTLAMVKIIGLAVGISTFLLTTLFALYEFRFDRQHPDYENIFRYVHRVKSNDELQSFAFTSATTAPALKERYGEVQGFTRIIRTDASLTLPGTDVSFLEKRFVFADEGFSSVFNFPLRQGDARKLLVEPYTLLITPSAAKKYFGDGDPVGQTLLFNGQAELVVKGIFEDDFNQTHLDFDFVASYASLETFKSNAALVQQLPAIVNLDNKGFAAFYTYLRLESPAAAASLESKLPAFIEEFRGKGRSERLKPTLQPMQSIHLQSEMLYEISANGSLQLVIVYVIIGTLVLLTSIVNYINMSMAEYLTRARNVGLKKILGISAAGVLGSFIVETMVVCAGALLIGLLAAALVLPFFNTVMRSDLSLLKLETFYVSISVFVVTVFFSALFPSFRIIRQNALGAFQGNWQISRASVQLRSGLVFLQLFVSFCLLTMALLIYRQTDFLLKKDPGFDAGQIIVINAASISRNDRQELKTRLLADTQVEAVSMCSVPPAEALFTFGLTLPGLSGDEDRRITVYQAFVDEDFLQTMGVEIETGRGFSREVPADSVNSIVVNRAAAEAISDSLMTRLIEIPNIYTGARNRKSVIGVMDDFHFASFHTAVQPLILEFNPKYARYMLVRFNPQHAREVVGVIEKNWRAMAPSLPLNYQFMDDAFATFYASEQRTREVVSAVSGLAIALAALGIFGSSLFAIQQRKKEIGVRKLLGSSILPLFALIIRPSIVLLGFAALVGGPLSYYLGQWWLSGYPFNTGFSLWLFAFSFAVILATIVAAMLFYLLRITRIQPAQVLRQAG